MQGELRSWLIGGGFPRDIELTAMPHDLGENELWLVTPAAGPAFVARVYPVGSATAGREDLAMTAAAPHGLPVPRVWARGVVAGRPVLVMSFVTGALAFEALTAQPEQAEALGRAMGETLGRLHMVAAPSGLSARTDAWLDLGGPALAPVRHLLLAVPGQDRLLHLDYHPKNVLVQAGRVVAVLDWENALAGPPHVDLARSRAILRAAVLGGLIPVSQRGAVAAFEAGLVAGHTALIGPDPHPALSAAWGLAMTVDDLTRQARKPGVFVTLPLLARLTAERDALVRSLSAGNAAPAWAERSGQ